MNHQKAKIYASAAATALFLALGSACTSTIVPPVPQANTPSWDGNAQNSGFLGYNPDDSGNLTEHAKDRYNALVAKYGAKLLPPVAKDEGLTSNGDGSFRIDAQHLAVFFKLRRWDKEGKPPGP